VLMKLEMLLALSLKQTSQSELEQVALAVSVLVLVSVPATSCAIRVIYNYRTDRKLVWVSMQMSNVRKHTIYTKYAIVIYLNATCSTHSACRACCDCCDCCAAVGVVGIIVVVVAAAAAADVRRCIAVQFTSVVVIAAVAVVVVAVGNSYCAGHSIILILIFAALHFVEKPNKIC